MKKTFCSRRAESLIETLVAITIIAIATTAAMILIRTSLTGNEVIGEKIIAMNLAEEGIEAVKNIRDTNYLRFSADPDSCWDTIDAPDVTSCSSVARFIDGWTYYYLTRNFDPTDSTKKLFEWSAVQTTSPETDGYLTLYEFTAGSETFEIYAQSGLTDAYLTPVSGTEDSFQRILAISNDSTGIFDVTATVNWWINGEMKTISLTRTIANVY